MRFSDFELLICGTGNAPLPSFFTNATTRTVDPMRGCHANRTYLFIVILIFTQNSFGQLMQKDGRLLDTKETKLFEVEEKGFTANRNDFLRWTTMGQEL